MKSIKIKIYKDGKYSEHKIPEQYGFDLEELVPLVNVGEAKELGATTPGFYIESIEVEEV